MSAESFEWLDGDGAGWAQIRFTGTFQGRQVTWLATVMSLRYYFEHFIASGLSPTTESVTLHSFIEIEAASAAPTRVRIALAVAKVDAPTLHKTVIMMRNYKRLRAGRHEFNPAQTFAHSAR